MKIIKTSQPLTKQRFYPLIGQKKAVVEGRDAYLQGKFKRANPYPKNSKDFFDWYQGWEQAAQDANDFDLSKRAKNYLFMKKESQNINLLENSSGPQPDTVYIDYLGDDGVTSGKVEVKYWLTKGHNPSSAREALEIVSVKYPDGRISNGEALDSEEYESIANEVYEEVRQGNIREEDITGQNLDLGSDNYTEDPLRVESFKKIMNLNKIAKKR